MPESLTFAATDTEKSFTFSATQDDVDDDDESVKLTLGTLPAGVSEGTTNTATVTITDHDVPAVTVSFGAATYAVAEGSNVTVKVTLSAAPERSVTVPLTASNQGGASAADYSGIPANMVFASGDTEQTFTVAATQDTVDDDGESVKLTFGTLPTAVTAGTTATSTVTITDDDVPAVTVSYGAATYAVAEGSNVTVKVTLSAAPERTVTIPLTATNHAGTTDSDYSGVPASVTFGATETEKSFDFAAAADDVDDDGESVALAFGTLPDGVNAGTIAASTVSITDDDVPDVTVGFGSATYSVAEDGTVDVTVTLDAAPERDVTIPIVKTDQGGASADDYSGVPESVTFGAAETEKSFTFSATADDVDDDDESVALAFGTLPTGVTAGTTSASTVTITDDDVPDVTVGFGSATYSVDEDGTVDVAVTLDTAPEREVTIPIVKTGQGGASAADYSGIPANVVFASGETEQTFTVAATQDTVDDDGESVKLTFGTLPTCCDRRYHRYQHRHHHRRRRAGGDGELRRRDLRRGRREQRHGEGHPERRPRAQRHRVAHGQQPGRDYGLGLQRRARQRHLRSYGDGKELRLRGGSRRRGRRRRERRTGIWHPPRRRERGDHQRLYRDHQRRRQPWRDH